MNPLAATEGPSYLFGQNFNKPTIVIIPSPPHTHTHYGPLSHHLQAQGHSSFALRLPSICDKANTGSAEEDVVTIRRVLEALVNEEEEDVIVVVHAYGGVPSSHAITGLERASRVRDGKRGGVVDLVFVGEPLVEEGGESIGTTLLEGLGEKGAPEDAKEETSILQPVDTPLSLSTHFPLLKAKYWTPQLEPQSAAPTMPKSICWGSLNIPVTYIQCSKDPKANAMGAMFTGKTRWIIKTIDASDDVFLSHVEELGEMIVKAEKVGRSGGMGCG